VDPVLFALIVAIGIAVVAAIVSVLAFFFVVIMNEDGTD